MKQRLLLALLVLFASVGMSKVKADVIINVPAGKTTESVTITFTSSEKTFVAPSTTSVGSYPVITGQISHVTVISDKAVYKIPYKESDTQTLSLVTEYGNWGDISISIDGKVTSFDASAETNLLKHVTSLSFTNNGELGEIKVGGMKEALKKIDVSNNKLSTLKGISDCTQIEEINISNNSFTSFGVSGLSKLKKLNVSDNKLESLTYPETLTDLTVGTQTISTSSVSTYTANGGINMKEVATTLFGIKPSDVDWDKVSFKWNKLIDGGKYDELKTSNDPHAVYTARKDFFLFFNDGSKVFTDGTYRCTMTYSGNTVIVKGIKINPAKFNLAIKQAEYIKVAKTNVASTTVNHGDEVTQGESLTLSTDYTGHSLSEWKLAGLDYTTTDQKEIEKEKQKDPVEVTVAGKWENGKTVDPEIDAAFKAAQWTVTYNNVKAESGSVSVKAVKDGKETALASGDKADAGSNIVVTVKTELGYFAKVTVNKEDKTLVDGVLTLENISKNLEITVDIQKNPTAKVSVLVIKDNVVSALDNNCFENGLLKIGSETYNVSSTEKNLSINADVQLSFALTKLSAESKTAPVIVEDILIGATSLKSTINKKETSDDIAAGISYDVTFKVPATNVTVTIKLKTLDLVTVNPEGKNNKQTYVYDGSAKKFQFATNPAGLEKEVKIGYRSINLSDPSKFGPDAPTAAGEYIVQYSRPASGNYAEVAENEDWKLVIEKATPQITTVPTVNVNKDGVYEIKNGVAKLGSTTLSGEWKIVTESGGTYTEVTDQKATDTNKEKPHLVWVQFVVKDIKGENTNFNKAYVQTNASIQGKGTVGKVKVAVSGDLPKGVVLKMYNGAQELTSTAAEVAKGSILTFKATYPENIEIGNGGTSVQSPLVLATNPNASSIYENLEASDYDWNTRTITFTLKNGVTENAVYTIKGSPVYEISKAFKVDLINKKAQYDGKTHEYELTNVAIKDQDGTAVSAQTSFSIPKLDKPIIITYKDQEGNVVPKPENVGKYTVGINIPYQGKRSIYKEYKEYQNDFVAILEITEAGTKVTEAPKSTLLAKNQKLSQSALVGGLVKSVNKDGTEIAPLAGVFEWKDKTDEAVDGKEYDVIFTPSDKNYAKATTKVKVYVSDKNLVTFAPQNGTVKVTDQNGRTYNSGDEIVKGTILTIVATPNESFVQKSLTVNGSAFTSSSTYTVKDESVAIEAIFAVKEPTPSSVVITLPANGKGYILSHNGAKSVAFNGSYTFNVSTLTADKKNLVVKAGSDILSPNTDGSYTVKADKDKTITITLSTPTKLKVSVERVTKNAKGYVIGKVEVEGLASDSTCYYGDEVTIVAFPESGVTFGGWSGSITSTDKLATFTVKDAMTIQPKFTGVLTGIDTIESTRVYGREGYLFIGCDGEATVTLISMDGRVKKVDISGDTRIETAAGVYGVIVEKEGEVLKEKVIVK